MPASPFVVTVREQRRRPGVPRSVRVAGPLPDLAVSGAAVPAGADVEAALALEAMTDGRITATGTVRAPWVGACRRCDEPVEGVLAADVQEVFEVDPVEGAETYPLDGDRVDLAPMVRDAVLLALPLAPLCGDGCRGPDSEGHPVLVHGEAHEERVSDPRWAALEGLRFDGEDCAP